MCANALNCTHSALIDGAGQLRSMGQLTQWVKHVFWTAEFTKIEAMP